GRAGSHPAGNGLRGARARGRRTKGIESCGDAARRRSFDFVQCGMFIRHIEEEAGSDGLSEEGMGSGLSRREPCAARSGSGDAARRAGVSPNVPGEACERNAAASELDGPGAIRRGARVLGCAPAGDAAGLGTFVAEKFGTKGVLEAGE